MALFKCSIRVRVETPIVSSIYKKNLKKDQGQHNVLVAGCIIHSLLWRKITKLCGLREQQLFLCHFVHLSVFLAGLGWDSAGMLSLIQEVQLKQFN